jgi:hypothetical protein
MAGPYDYSINIPQPPAQNFLQSLLGIQQLKGLQQQSQLAEQQAAIQQQQAAFAQQMQPLQMEAEQARIAAAKANTAQSGVAADIGRENLRQSKITFGREEALAKEADALRADMMKLSADPTSATREKLLDLSYRAAAFAPKSYEPLQKMLKDYPRTGKMLENTASDVIFSVQSGQPGVAAGSVNKTIEAAQGALELNPNDKDAQAALALLQPVQSLMKEEKYGEAMITASNFLRNMFPERWDAVTKDMKEFGAIAETSAKAKKEQAATEGQLLENRIKKYEADNGVSLADIQKNKQEIFKLEAAERAHIESNPFVRKYIDSRTAFEIMKDAPPNASGDEELLTQFVKMGDPGSVVSVTEKGGTRNVTISDYMRSLQAKVMNEGSLGDAKRKELKDAAFKMLQAPQKQYKEYQGKLEPVYRKQGLNPENIFVLPSSEQLLENAKSQAAESQMSSEEQRIRGMLRPAAGFGNTMTPSQIPFQGSTFQGTPTDVDAILKQYLPR